MTFLEVAEPPRVPNGVTCQCSLCDCERLDKGLNYATSSLLWCYSCCIGRHKRPADPVCRACGQLLP